MGCREMISMHTPVDPHDPTKMLNQPALRTSDGRIWLIVGALFLIATLVPLVALIAKQGASMQLAVIIAIGAIGLYLAMIVTRIVTKPGVKRLRTLATFFLAMAALSLFGLLACWFLERANVA